MTRKSNTLYLFTVTALAMLAFAANSILARLALSHADIGPWGFTAIRLISGALILALIAKSKKAETAGDWISAGSLILYAACFSYAYLQLAAGTGALILFAVVQITMIGGGLISGERLSKLQWLGTIIALAGLVYLLSPSIQAPPLFGAMLMMFSGLGWGLYSLRGRKAGDPTAQTTGNFIRAGLICALATPFILGGLKLGLLNETAPNTKGVMLALASGTITSALGYVIWYMALKHLTATRAGIAQLTVPVIAAIGGMIFISEPLTLRFLILATIILSGVGIATMTRRKT